MISLRRHRTKVTLTGCPCCHHARLSETIPVGKRSLLENQSGLAQLWGPLVLTGFGTAPRSRETASFTSASLSALRTAGRYQTLAIPSASTCTLGSVIIRRFPDTSAAINGGNTSIIFSCRASSAASRACSYACRSSAVGFLAPFFHPTPSPLLSLRLLPYYPPFPSH